MTAEDARGAAAPPRADKRGASQVRGYRPLCVSRCGAISTVGNGRLTRAAQYSSSFVLAAVAGEGGRTTTVDRYRKVRLACAKGVSQREAARLGGGSIATEMQVSPGRTPTSASPKPSSAISRQD